MGGKTTVKYKLRDWVFSRQRYWGEPIPLVNCEKCGWVLVPEKDLPIKLPKVAKYEPTDTGESPLSLMPKWVNTKCPECKGPAKRETDTMPNWAGSSWYFLRYCDPTNSKQFADSRKLSYWQPVDWYNGGMEHVTLHLLYSRFWNLFLYDLGLVPTKEPYKKRTAHGMILAADGKKMSKSVGNVVNPDDLVKEFGGDALRLYELFIGPFDQAVQWDPRGILGTARFLEKVWRVGQHIAHSKLQIAETDSKLASLLNKTVQKVGADIEAANFNTAVSAMMIFVNELAADNLQLTVQDWQKFLLILSPFAPHIAEELNEMLSRELLCESAWPKVDEASIAESTYELIIQVNSKVRATFDIKKGTSQAEVERLVAEIPEMQKWLIAPAKRVIFVKDRLINFIV